MSQTPRRLYSFIMQLSNSCSCACTRASPCQCLSVYLHRFVRLFDLTIKFQVQILFVPVSQHKKQLCGTPHKVSCRREMCQIQFLKPVCEWTDCLAFAPQSFWGRQGRVAAQVGNCGFVLHVKQYCLSKLQFDRIWSRFHFKH